MASTILGAWLILAGVFPSDRRVELLELVAGTCLQHIPELFPVSLRRLHFEPVDLRVRHHAVIERECLAFLPAISAHSCSLQKSRSAARKIWSVVRRCWPSITWRRVT